MIFGIFMPTNIICLQKSPAFNLKRFAESTSFARMCHQDKELKASADSTLCEVRAKLADVKRATQLVETLTRLRQVRKSLADANGESAEFSPVASRLRYSDEPTDTYR